MDDTTPRTSAALEATLAQTHYLGEAHRPLTELARELEAENAALRRTLASANVAGTAGARLNQTEAHLRELREVAKLAWRTLDQAHRILLTLEPEDINESAPLGAVVGACAAIASSLFVLLMERADTPRG